MPTAQPTMTSRRRSPPSVKPRFATRRRPERPTFGGRLAKIAELLGTPFMPWQRAAVDVACEYDPATGVPFYREVDLLVMRQQGKTTLELCAVVDRFVSWESRQRIVYSAQTGADARKKLLDDWAPALQGSPLAPLVSTVVKSNGREQIVWADGSRVEVMASLAASGHGFTVDFGMIDEAWKDYDERREGAIRPAQLTIPDAQLWVVSTAGTEDSTYLKRKVEAGRAAAEDDAGHGICYIEYSLAPDEDPYDLDVMLRRMPALCPTPGPCGCSDEWRHTVTQEALANEMVGMEGREYRRAFGNLFVERVREASPIPWDLYEQCQSTTAAPSGELRIGLDVTEDRRSASIAVCGNGVVELVGHDQGVGWAVQACKDARARWGGEIVVDGNGPAAPVADDLEREGIPVTRLSNGEVIAACGRVYDAVADGKVVFRRSDRSGSMDAAVKGLAKKPAGDRFAWSRSASTEDITPWFAATLAFAHSGDAPLDGELMA